MVLQCAVKVEYYQFYIVWHISKILISLNSDGKGNEICCFFTIFAPKL